MKFGSVENINDVNFTLPVDDKITHAVLNKPQTKLEISLGHARWSKDYLKGFYPKGSKNELEYYSKNYNSIELNAFFYRIFPQEVIEKWCNTVPLGFKFYPKITQRISQFKRLKNIQDDLNNYLEAVCLFEDKLGCVFLQMHPNFSPKYLDDLKSFIRMWPNEIPLAIELRDPAFFTDEKIREDLYGCYRKNNISNIISDTAGERNLIHMAMTNQRLFLRFTGASDQVDGKRLEDWVERIVKWNKIGLKYLDLFVHQNNASSPTVLSHKAAMLLKEAFKADIPLPNAQASPTLF